jgi:hypothetical protein
VCEEACSASVPSKTPGVSYQPMVGGVGEAVTGVMSHVAARDAQRAGGVEDGSQLDENDPHADGGEVVAHANDRVEAQQVVPKTDVQHADGDAGVAPLADEVEGAEAGSEIPMWRCVTCQLHKLQTTFPNNRGINCRSCKNGWAALWRVAKRTSPTLKDWLLHFKHNFPTVARIMYSECRVHEGYQAQVQVMTRYAALHPLPAANAHPAAKAKAGDIPPPAAPAPPRFHSPPRCPPPRCPPRSTPHVERRGITRRRDGDGYQVIDVCSVAYERCVVGDRCVCVALI